MTREWCMYCLSSDGRLYLGFGRFIDCLICRKDTR